MTQPIFSGVSRPQGVGVQFLEALKKLLEMQQQDYDTYITVVQPLLEQNIEIVQQSISIFPNANFEQRMDFIMQIMLSLKNTSEFQNAITALGLCHFSPFPRKMADIRASGLTLATQLPLNSTWATTTYETYPDKNTAPPYGKFFFLPLVGASGNIYVPQSGRVVKFDPSGAILWTALTGFTETFEEWENAILDEDETVIMAWPDNNWVNNYIVKVSIAGVVSTVKLDNAFPHGADTQAAVVVGPYLLIMVNYGSQAACVNKDTGALLWITDCLQEYSPIVSDGVFFSVRSNVSAEMEYFAMELSTGRELWKKTEPTGQFPDMLGAGTNGLIYVALDYFVLGIHKVEFVTLHPQTGDFVDRDIHSAEEFPFLFDPHFGKGRALLKTGPLVYITSSGQLMKYEPKTRALTLIRDLSLLGAGLGQDKVFHLLSDQSGNLYYNFQVASGGVLPYEFEPLNKFFYFESIDSAGNLRFRISTYHAGLFFAVTPDNRILIDGLRIIPFWAGSFWTIGGYEKTFQIIGGV